MVRGYLRVSTKAQARDGNSLEAQEKLLKANGAEKIYCDAFTGTKRGRPQFQKLLDELEEGDTLIVTKLDRFARSIIQGKETIDKLINDGIKVNILNIGVMDNTPSSKLIRNIFFSFAEFERDMIVERTQEGKMIAKERAKAEGKKFKEGRPQKYTINQIENALELLETKSYNKVSEITGMSISTLTRVKRRMKACNMSISEFVQMLRQEE